MNRQPSFCDFCGFPDVRSVYPTDAAGFDWYACAACAELIADECWERLVERCVAAHDGTRVLSEDERRVVTDQVESLIRAFRELSACPGLTCQP